LLLEILGSSGFSKEQVYEFFDELTKAHDYAVKIIRTPFAGDLEVCKAARPTVIDGTRSLLEQGYHREAMYWIVICRSWTQGVMENDAPRDEKMHFEKKYRSLLSALGYGSADDLERKTAATKLLMPKVMKVAEKIAEKTGS
jgi:hypothetical protein